VIIMQVMFILMRVCGWEHECSVDSAVAHLSAAVVEVTDESPVMLSYLIKLLGDVSVSAEPKDPQVKHERRPFCSVIGRANSLRIYSSKGVFDYLTVLSFLSSLSDQA